jgi:pimeloyl-ACP methyl ester carboxylesterase
MIESVMDELGLDQIDLVANDSGTGIVQIFAANHPKRLRTLALTNGDVHDNWPTPDFSNVIQLIKSGGAVNVFRSLLANHEAGRLALAAGFEHPDELSDETIAAYFGPLLANEESGRTFERMTETFDNTQTVRVEEKLRKLQAPTLILWGTADTFFDVKWAYWLADTIPGVLEVVEVPGAKLFFPAERPEFVAEHVLKLWRTYDASHAPALDAEEH